MSFIQLGNTRVNVDNIAAFSPFTLDVVGIRIKYGIKIIYVIDPECQREIMYLTEETRNEALARLDSIMDVKKM